MSDDSPNTPELDDSFLEYGPGHNRVPDEQDLVLTKDVLDFKALWAATAPAIKDTLEKEESANRSSFATVKFICAAVYVSRIPGRRPEINESLPDNIQKQLNGLALEVETLCKLLLPGKTASRYSLRTRVNNACKYILSLQHNNERELVDKLLRYRGVDPILDDAREHGDKEDTKRKVAKQRTKRMKSRKPGTNTFVGDDGTLSPTLEPRLGASSSLSQPNANLNQSERIGETPEVVISEDMLGAVGDHLRREFKSLTDVRVKVSDTRPLPDSEFCLALLQWTPSDRDNDQEGKGEDRPIVFRLISLIGGLIKRHDEQKWNFHKCRGL